MKKLALSLFGLLILAACAKPVDDQIEGAVTVTVTEAEPMGIDWILSNLWPDFQIASMCWDFISGTMEFLDLPLDDVQWLNRAYPLDALNQTQSIISVPALGLQLNESNKFQDVFLKVTPVSTPEAFEIRENSIKLVKEAAGFVFIVDIIGHEDERLLSLEQWQDIANGIVEIIEDSSEEMRLEKKRWAEAERLDRKQGERESIERIQSLFTAKQHHILEEMPFVIPLFDRVLSSMESNWNHPYNRDPRTWENSHQVFILSLDDMPDDYDVHDDVGVERDVLSFVQLEIRDESGEETKEWIRLIKLDSTEGIYQNEQRIVRESYYMITSLPGTFISDRLWEIDNH